MPRLRPSDDFLAEAHTILYAERARLAPLGDDHELLLVGGCSVPGALTKGDVDLHLRTPPGAFEKTVDRLRNVYRVVLPSIWQPTLATFALDAALPTGIAVTPKGSEHDLRFTRTWQRLAADPALLAAYNQMKLAFHHDRDEYERRKSAFFDDLTAH
ncbi:hypothetical protein Ade02nite_55760 [Paractinoplanes deccanensis]|uniref:GrpB family protein n=1 Tax=Paractinoplanes deccanensis TaxID=113561 RepID=A0ABQ3YAT4_9ACTN|nr:GrpB family protein [Actinoplanes deccanensis]GID76935.1 hypothetical protein Ade02nite_55760 [Actinoplanes deccanensis]